jgi:phosphoglycerate kinase
MRTIDVFDFSGKRALIRVDFNVPLNASFEVTDNSRMLGAIPTIQKILKDGGSVVLMSHLGRPKNGPEEKFSLKHLVAPLSNLLNLPVRFASDCRGSVAFEAASSLQAGEVLLLENLRFYSEEEKGDLAMAQELAFLGDVYVNDAFGTAHRAHASTAVIAQFAKEKCFGYLMAAELQSVEQVMKNPKKPFTAIIGGAKVSSKISIINNLLDKIDNLVIGGGMSYTFAKAMGGEVGNSMVEEDYIETARELLKKADELGVKILLPEDSIIADKFDPKANKKEVNTNEIPEGWMGLDIGTKAIKKYETCVEESRTILWNGPMGVFEFKQFEEGTKALAFAVVTATERGAYSLVGGGDSVAAVNKYNLGEHVSYVSTGGGALLELIEGRTLPGVAAILEA